MLAVEVVTSRSMVPQQHPDQIFCVGLVLAQFASETQRFFRDVVVAWGCALNPPPERRGEFIGIFDKTFHALQAGFVENDPDTLHFFNHWMLPGQQDGWLKERHDYWFETRDWAGSVVE